MVTLTSRLECLYLFRLAKMSLKLHCGDETWLAVQSYPRFGFCVVDVAITTFRSVLSLSSAIQSVIVYLSKGPFYMICMHFADVCFWHSENSSPDSLVEILESLFGFCAQISTDFKVFGDKHGNNPKNPRIFVTFYFYSPKLLEQDIPLELSSASRADYKTIKRK